MFFLLYVRDVVCLFLVAGGDIVGVGDVVVISGCGDIGLCCWRLLYCY